MAGWKCLTEHIKTVTTCCVLERAFLTEEQRMKLHHTPPLPPFSSSVPFFWSMTVASVLRRRLPSFDPLNTRTKSNSIASQGSGWLRPGL